MMMLLISDCLVSTQREKRKEKREKREEKEREKQSLSLSLSPPFFFYFSSPVPRRGACGATKVLSFLN